VLELFPKGKRAIKIISFIGQGHLSALHIGIIVQKVKRVHVFSGKHRNTALSVLYPSIYQIAEWFKVLSLRQK
jgi:hypothetical protein